MCMKLAAICCSKPSLPAFLRQVCRWAFSRLDMHHAAMSLQVTGVSTFGKRWWSSLPSLPDNAQYVQHKNKCFDWGTFGWALFNLDLDITEYQYFVFMNTSVRGPYLAPYTVSTWQIYPTVNLAVHAQLSILEIKHENYKAHKVIHRCAMTMDGPCRTSNIGASFSPRASQTRCSTLLFCLRHLLPLPEQLPDTSQLVRLKLKGHVCSAHHQQWRAGEAGWKHNQL